MRDSQKDQEERRNPEKQTNETIPAEQSFKEAVIKSKM